MAGPNFSTIETTSTVSGDVDAPAPPLFATKPSLNPDGTKYFWEALLPSFDAKDNGTAPLTGLANFHYVTAPMTDGVNPFIGLTAKEALAMPGSIPAVTPITPELAGTHLHVEVDNMGGGQAFAQFVDDGAA